MKSVKRKDVMEGQKKKEPSRGARNLVILGVAATLVAVSTTGVSLAIYHNSGDIYLDRSRPGYLPDKAEIEEEEGKEDEDDYDFEKSGKLTAKDLDEYLKELEKEVRAINSYEKPFSEDVLSDESLGIPADVPAETDDSAGDA